jgi:hypothetical protein
MSENQYEFGSPDWLAVLQATFEKTVAADAQSGDADFSICEVYTDVPERVSAEPKVAWHLRVKGNEVVFLAEEADDVDIKIVGEWSVISKLGRLEYGEEGPPPDATAEIAQATREGRFQFTANPNMNPAPPGFAAVHNQVARRTL